MRHLKPAELAALAGATYLLLKHRSGALVSPSGAHPMPVLLAPDESQMDGYGRRSLRGFRGLAGVQAERYVDVLQQVNTCLVVQTRNPSQAYTVWPCDPGIGGSSGAGSTGPLADQLRALAGTGRGAWITGDWNDDIPFKVVPSSVRLDSPVELPSEKYGGLELNAGRLLFRVHEGPDKDRAFQVNGPAVAQLSPLVGTPQGDSYYLTSVWTSNAITPTASRPGPLVTLTKEETGRATDMVVSPNVADASRAGVADGRGSWLPQKAEDGYFLPDGTSDVPMALQGGGVTVTGVVHPDILKQTPLLVSVLKETARRTGTSMADQFAKVSDQLLHMNPDSAELHDYLDNTLAPAAGVSSTPASSALKAAGIGALLFFALPALAKKGR